MPIGRIIRKYITEPAAKRKEGMKEWLTKRKLRLYSKLGSEEARKKLELIESTEKGLGKFHVRSEILNMGLKDLEWHINMRKELMEHLNKVLEEKKGVYHRGIVAEMMHALREDPYFADKMLSTLLALRTHEARTNFLKNAEILDKVTEWTPGVKVGLAGRIFHRLGRGPSDLRKAEELRRFFRDIGAGPVEALRVAHLAVKDPKAAEAYMNVAALLSWLGERNVEMRNAMMDPKRARAMSEILARVAERMFDNYPPKTGEKYTPLAGEPIGRIVNIWARGQPTVLRKAEKRATRSRAIREMAGNVPPPAPQGEASGYTLVMEHPGSASSVKIVTPENVGAGGRAKLKQITLDEVFRRLRAAQATRRLRQKTLDEFIEKYGRKSGSVRERKAGRPESVPIDKYIRTKAMLKAFMRDPIWKEIAMEGFGPFAKRMDRAGKVQTSESIAFEALARAWGREDVAYAKKRRRELIAQIAKLLHRHGILINASTPEMAARQELAMLRRSMRENRSAEVLEKRIMRLMKRIRAVTPGTGVPGTMVKKEGLVKRIQMHLDELKRIEAILREAKNA